VFTISSFIYYCVVLSLLDLTLRFEIKLPTDYKKADEVINQNEVNYEVPSCLAPKQTTYK